jgi:hypothetical protein
MTFLKLGGEKVSDVEDGGEETFQPPLTDLPGPPPGFMPPP